MSTLDRGSVELQLLGQLRQLVGQPMTAKIRESVLMIVDRMLLNFSRLSGLGRGEEYMSEVLTVRPNWQRKIKALKSANKACMAALDELSHRISHELPLADIDQDVGRELNQWMESLAVIRGQETRLHQRAYTLDLGGES